MDLIGKVAVITAGANGIGEGAAMALAERGADIAICDIDTENGARVVSAVEALGRRALFVPANMMEEGAAAGFVEQAGQHFGRVDILINNAGGVKPRLFADQNMGNWRRIIDLNLMSMLEATQVAARWMKQGKAGGAIVNIASTEALHAAPGFSVYAACKAAMVQFTKTMALELGPDGVRVNAIAPDLVATPGLAPHLKDDEASIEIRSRYVPLGRMASIAEAGSVIAFLATDQSSYVTGVTIPLDGGLTAGGGWYRNEEQQWVMYP